MNPGFLCQFLNPGQHGLLYNDCWMDMFLSTSRMQRREAVYYSHEDPQ